MTRKELLESFKKDVRKLDDVELVSLESMLMMDPAMGRYAEDEFVLAVHGEYKRRGSR